MKQKGSFKARLLPWAILSVAYASKSARFDFKSTMLTGSLMSKNKNSVLVTINNNEYEGWCYGRAIVVGKDWVGLKKVIAHEIVHQFQFGEYQILNSWLQPVSKNIKSRWVKKIFTDYVYLDLPYSNAFYLTQKQNQNQSYYKNFYEFEAERFATNKFVQR